MSTCLGAQRPLEQSSSVRVSYSPSRTYNLEQHTLKQSIISGCAEIQNPQIILNIKLNCKIYVKIFGLKMVLKKVKIKKKNVK